MNDQLESDLRVALQERASLVPAATARRIAAHEYRPRRHRVRPPVALGATALTSAAAAAAAAVVFSLGAGASNAFAGWTAKPTAPAPGQLHAAGAACQASRSPIAGLPLQLTDTRGPFTFSIYADSQASATCIKGPSFTAASGSMSSAPISVPAGQIELSTHRPGTDRTGQPYSFAVGRTGAGVTGVTLALDDGTSVQATVGNGWLVAWWPGDHTVTSAQVTTPAGVQTQTFDFPPAGAQPGGASTSGSATMNSAGAKGAGQSVQSFSVSP